MSENQLLKLVENEVSEQEERDELLSLCADILLDPYKSDHYPVEA